jgi:hypothetical protein
MEAIMHRSIALIFFVALSSIIFGTARADTPALDHWFLHATAYETNGTAHAMARPDFMCGKTFASMGCHLKSSATRPIVFYGVWELLFYDQKHHIAFAHANTDQESYALFQAPPPPVSAPNADLSQVSTGRGLRIGSPYAQVLSTYGPPALHGQRFATLYAATFPYTDPFLNRHEMLDEIVTLVIDKGQVSSISIYIQCCNG